MEELARLNGLKDPSRIRAGQVLRVRPGVEVALPRGSLVYFPPIQGRAFALWVEGYTQGYAEFLGVRYPLVPGEKGLWALLAVGALVEPKGYPLRLVLEGEESLLILEVAPGDYRRETLALTPSLEELLKDPGLKVEREKVVGACPREGPLTFSRFLKPLEGGRITSAFGTRRRYGTLFTSYHEGLDFAAPLGTPVRAVAGGGGGAFGKAEGAGRGSDPEPRDGSLRGVLAPFGKEGEGGGEGERGPGHRPFGEHGAFHRAPPASGGAPFRHPRGPRALLLGPPPTLAAGGRGPPRGG